MTGAPEDQPSTTGPPTTPSSSNDPKKPGLGPRIIQGFPFFVQTFGMSMVCFDVAFVHPLSSTMLSIGGMLAGGGGVVKFSRKGGL